MDKSSIARRELIAESRDGTKFPIAISIGLPKLGIRGEWVCTVAFEGIPDATETAHGMDYLQSLLLAVALARGRLSRFEKEGGKFYLPGDEVGGSMPVAELFGDSI